jgi:dTDP-glucose pyrophosphorylase
MINILIPLAGKNQFFPESEYPYPKPLIEINGKTMIERIVENFATIQKDKQFIFIVNSDDCKKYHLDNVLNLLTNHTCRIIKIDRETKGAACSAMMAIEYINNNMPLIIANADQLFDDNLDVLVNQFQGYDGGVLSFESIHPRWSYARVNKENFITETAEKRPISKHAIAGFYYFANGQDFIAGAMRMIQKDANVNGLYFIAPVLNEMVLENKKMNVVAVSNNHYHTFYTPAKIQEYERISQC